MNTGDDSIISQLSLSASDVKRLTVTQIRNINTLLVTPPPALLDATRRIGHAELIQEFRLYHIPIHAVEFPLTQLLRFMRDLIPHWRITHQEQNILSASLSRNAASQIVSIPLFIAIWGALAEQRPVSDVSPLQKAIESSKKIVELEFPSTHFIYGLIFQRLGHNFQTRVNQGALLHMRWEDLKREMVTMQIKLSEGSFQDFKTSLTRSGIYYPFPDNRVHIPMLLATAEDYTDHLANLTEEVNDRHECPISSTVARMLREIRPNWASMKKVLVEQQQRMQRYDHSQSNGGGSGVSEDAFTSVLRRTGGVIVTVEDAEHFWEYLVMSSSTSSYRGQFARGEARYASLSLEQLEHCLAPSEQTYASLSNLMREKHTYTHKPRGDTRLTEDHMKTIFSTQEQEENNSAASNVQTPQHSSLAHFPWQKDEANPVSNLKLRALQGLQQCSAEVKQRFVQLLYSKEYSFNFSIARSILHEGFSMVGIHFTPQDMHTLWLEIQATLNTLQASELLRWLHLDHIPYSRSTTVLHAAITGEGAGAGGRSSSHQQMQQRNQCQQPSAGKLDSAKPNGNLDPSYSPRNPRHASQPHTSWDSCYSEEETQQQGQRQQSTLSSFVPQSIANNEEPDSTSSPIEDIAQTSASSKDEGAMVSAAYKETLTSLLKARPQLAHAFRRISSGSGLGKGVDVCDALLRHPFCVSLSEEQTWELVCRMAGVEKHTLPARVYLRFNDAISFLEREAAELLKPPHDPRRLSIQHKLQECRHVRGSRIEMIEQSHILRSRLRHIRQRGSVTSWDAVPDICYPQEFNQLMESISLCFTQEEIIYIYRSINKEEDPINTPSSFNQCRYGMPLGASISFLSSLCSQP